MSFLSEIKKFSKSSLKKADTEVTTVGGRRVRETRDEHGHVTSEVRSLRLSSQLVFLSLESLTPECEIFTCLEYCDLTRILF